MTPDRPGALSLSAGSAVERLRHLGIRVEVLEEDADDRIGRAEVAGDVPVHAIWFVLGRDSSDADRRLADAHTSEPT